ncbi:MAG: MerR family transcriptional regulator [Bifidobacteriaceae bacterium]|jgi:DNA-binding transcriptional MerR regulator|nr:MerR family transcriptional regulator [Bifidobacteriaceae bacterium]
MNAVAGARSWPQGLSHHETYSISAVLEELRQDFPDLTISKLRYLEDQGLLTPGRTPSGYRRYSEADIERAAWVLAQQRDLFLPLRVIRERLALMDSARDPDLVPSPRGPRRARVAPDDVATVTGQERALVEAVAKAAGVPGGVGDSALVEAVEAVAQLASYGLDLRHLKVVFQAAQRQADLIELASNAVRGPGSPGIEAADAVAADCVEAMSRLFAAVLQLQFNWH